MVGDHGWIATRGDRFDGPHRLAHPVRRIAAMAQVESTLWHTLRFEAPTRQSQSQT